MPVSFYQISFVRIAFYCTSHMKILTFRGVLDFQSLVLGLFVSLQKRCSYIDFTVKIHDFSQIHLTVSFSLESAHNTNISLIYLS
jgi:hypothetical protein